MKEERILYILRHNPWGIGGGCYACRCYLDAFTTAFTDAQFDVCICAEYLPERDLKVDYPNVNFIGVPKRKGWEKALTPITGLLHRFDNIARALLKHNNYDLCIFDHNSIAGPLVTLCKTLGIKTVVINHNCEAEYYKDNYVGFVHQHVFLPHVRSAERKSYLGCDFNIFLTKEDYVLFEKLYGESQTKPIVLGCFEPKNKQDRNIANIQRNGRKNEYPLKMVISGTIGNVQNLDGINYFLDELLPHVPNEVIVVIAGKNPPSELFQRIESINEQRNGTIQLVPNPSDMMSIVSDCDIFVCPTRLGGGIKLRVMDGLKAGLPVIAHTVSARGYSDFIEKGMMWSFDNADGFAKAQQSVFKRIKDGRLSKTDIQEFAVQQFSFEKKVELIKKYINVS